MSNAAKSATPFLPLDFIEAHAFLNRLDPTAETFTFQTFDDHTTRRDTSLVSVIHGTLEASWETLAHLNQHGAGSRHRQPHRRQAPHARQHHGCARRVGGARRRVARKVAARAKPCCGEFPPTAGMHIGSPTA